MTPAAAALANYMSKLSESAYHAGWMMHLEFALWHGIVTGPFRYGRLDLTQTHLDELRRLSDACGGWIYFDAKEGETWVSLTEWQDMYSRNIDLVELD